MYDTPPASGNREGAEPRNHLEAHFYYMAQDPNIAQPRGGQSEARYVRMNQPSGKEQKKVKRPVARIAGNGSARRSHPHQETTIDEKRTGKLRVSGHN